MQPLPRTRSCFVCGVYNPLGFNLQMHTHGRIVEARFEFKPEHVGFRKTVHGGLIATILDELMVWACGVATRRFAYCAEMTVRYRRPVTPGVPVFAQAEMIEDRKGRIYVARATLREAASEHSHAEGSGKYIPMDSGEMTFMGEDFVDDPASIIQ